MKRNRSKDQVIASGILIISIIIVGGAGGGWLLLGWSDIATELIMNGMVALGTLTLAVVAWVQNRDTIEQMKTDRAKPGVLKLIGHWMDPLIEEIESRQKKLEHQESKEAQSFKQVKPVRDPFINTPFKKTGLPDQILEEIETYYPELSDDIDIFNETAENYTETKRELRSDLSDYFSNKLSEYIDSEEAKKEVTKALEEDGRDDITALEFLEKETHNVGLSVIDGKIDSYKYTEAFWEHSSLHPLEVREHDRFKEKFSELESDQEELEVICDQIYSDLKQARAKMMDDYDLVESEVIELKANMNDFWTR